MPRRFLTLSEAESLLNRGKAIECFLGACERSGKRGIKWFSAAGHEGKVRLALYQTADPGSRDRADLYSFGPLDPALEPDEPDQALIFENFEGFVSRIETMFPSSSSRLVNQGVIQDEYLAFLERGGQEQG